MARPLRVEYRGAFYHISSRGNARQDIFLSDSDRNSFIRILAYIGGKMQWKCHAYCLMDNHYHLLIETQFPNLSQGMRQLNGLYSQYFNREHSRDGHLFQGRYQAIILEGDRQLIALVVYMAMNPVKAGLARRARDYRWGSYKATAGLAEAPKWLCTELILGQFGAKVGKARQELANYVERNSEGIGNPLEEAKGQIFLGSDEFAERHTAKTTSKEVPRGQRRPVRRSLSKLLAGGGKPKEIEAAYAEGYRMVDIAKHLKVHYTTVSQRLRRAGRTLYVKT